ncbi:MAG: DinB family protein [Bacteroidales bacterium]|nr:DinB family protein [Bacteroidales bacterium]
MKTVSKENLFQLKDLLLVIDKNNYTEKPEVLSGASIGQHMRHILEFYLLLVSGSFSGAISYDKRERDIRIEADPEFAINTIDRLLRGIDTLDETLQVYLEADYSISGATQNNIISSVGRELAYCIEHSIHHQALIKAGLIAMGLKSLTNEHFGVAYSTIRYRNSSCAQ